MEYRTYEGEKCNGMKCLRSEERQPLSFQVLALTGGTSYESCWVKSCYVKFTHFCNSLYLLSDVPVAPGSPAANSSRALVGWYGGGYYEIFRKKEKKEGRKKHCKLVWWPHCELLINMDWKWNETNYWSRLLPKDFPESLFPLKHGWRICDAHLCSDSDGTVFFGVLDKRDGVATMRVCVRAITMLRSGVWSMIRSSRRLLMSNQTFCSCRQCFQHGCRVSHLALPPASVK